MTLHMTNSSEQLCYKAWWSACYQVCKQECEQGLQISLSDGRMAEYKPPDGAGSAASKEDLRCYTLQ